MYCGKGKGKLGAYNMKRVAAGVHLPTHWLFEPAERPDDRADYCLDTAIGSITDETNDQRISVRKLNRFVSIHL